MDELKRCPVCKNVIQPNACTCPVCGMSDLNRIFLDREERDIWVEEQLNPHISSYQAEKAAAAVGHGNESISDGLPIIDMEPYNNYVGPTPPEIEQEKEVFTRACLKTHIIKTI